MEEKLESIIFGLKETIKEKDAEIAYKNGIIDLLNKDIEDLHETLEKSVEDVYKDFMQDYKLMREELDGTYDELKDLREERENMEREIFGLEEEKRQAVKDTAQEALEAFICRLINARLVGTKDDLYDEMLEAKDYLLQTKYGVEVE